MGPHETRCGDLALSDGFCKYLLAQDIPPDAFVNAPRSRFIR